MTTRREFLTHSAGFVLSGKVGPLLASATVSGSDRGAGAAQRVLQRILPDHAHQFSLKCSASPSPVELFTITGKDGNIGVEGSTVSALLMGVHWYLKYVAGASISWNGNSLDRLPATLPAPSATVSQEATVRHRFALNDTNDGYTGPYWTWIEWEHFIDVLALHGINEVLVYMGAEAVYQRTLLQFGYSNQELRNWFPTPAHQPWWLLQNISAWVGPALSQHMIDKRLALAQKICARLRELEMEPVFPGYYGTVPDGFAQRNSDARIVAQGKWLGMKRPDWLDPTCATFARVARAFYKTQRDLLGESNMFKMDPLHEGGDPGTLSVTEAARHIDSELQAAHPAAIWAALGWVDNPRPDLLKGIQDKSRVLVLDGVSDRYSGLDREAQWNNTPYAFGTIWNYGGRTTIGANLGVWNERFYKQLRKRGSKLQGLALMPEQSCNNPAAFEFFTELGWRAEPVNLEAWFRRWSAIRYGIDTDTAARAWDILRLTAYGETPGEFAESHDNLFSAQPGLTVNKAFHWAPDKPRYDLAVFSSAIDSLLQMPPAARATSAYRYDLVDVARQTIANESRIILPRINAAGVAKNQEEFRRQIRIWFERLDALESVVSCDAAFMLGPWLMAARNAALDEAERKQFSFDACSLLVQWGSKETRGSFVTDYANREWTGLLDFYRQRWKRYFDSVEVAMESGREPETIDWFSVNVAWSKEDHAYPDNPRKDFYAAVKAAVSNRVS